MKVFVLTGIMIAKTTLGINVDRHLQVFKNAEDCLERESKLIDSIEKSGKYYSFKTQCEASEVIGMKTEKLKDAHFDPCKHDKLPHCGE